MDKHTKLATTLLSEREVTLLDAARLIRNVLDSFSEESGLTPVQFCAKVISTGLRHIRNDEMSIRNGFMLYLETKKNLRPESLRDIRYLGSRLIKSNPKFGETYFSELKSALCEQYLSSTFKTPSQFNKARTMLYGLFEFALKREWCDKNPIKLIEKQKVIEKEIIPLSNTQTESLLKSAENAKKRDCLPAVGLLLFAGIRPREVRRLKWKDIDLEEGFITVRSQCSKTGGVRHVEIMPALKRILAKYKSDGKSAICPPDWNRKWKNIREESGFKGTWVQDVLRHTYASYFAKRFRDLPRLQLNMGHRDLSLLRSRYVNMAGIKKSDAKAFFESMGRNITSEALPLN